MRALALAVMVAACAHLGAARAQSAALVIQEAATRRECADMAKAAASRPATEVALPERCRAIEPNDRQRTAALVVGFALLAAVLGGCVLLWSKAARAGHRPP